MFLPHFGTSACIAVHRRSTASNRRSSYTLCLRAVNELAILIEGEFGLADVEADVRANEATGVSYFVVALEPEASRFTW